MAKVTTTELLRQIETAHDLSGGAAFDPKLWLPRMKTLEKRGLIEIHLLGNGKHCARITDAGRKAARLTERKAAMKISRIDAIKIIDRATDKDDPFWEHIVEDWYDEKKDDIPSIYDVLAALGVTEAEYRKASGADGKIKWPK